MDKKIKNELRNNSADYKSMPGVPGRISYTENGLQIEDVTLDFDNAIKELFKAFTPDEKHDYSNGAFGYLQQLMQKRGIQKGAVIDLGKSKPIIFLSIDIPHVPGQEISRIMRHAHNVKIIQIQPKPNDTKMNTDFWHLDFHSMSSGLIGSAHLRRIIEPPTIQVQKQLSKQIIPGSKHTSNFSKNTSGVGYIPKAGPVGVRRPKNKRKKGKK